MATVSCSDAYDSTAMNGTKFYQLLPENERIYWDSNCFKNMFSYCTRLSSFKSGWFNDITITSAL